MLEMQEPPEKKLRYDKYFFINRSKDGKLGFRRNPAAIDKELSRCGFFMIAETDFTKTTSEVLDIYRCRDVVEKSFDNLKNELDMRRLYVHSDEVAEGKAFCAFIALIVRSHIQNVLQEYMCSRKYTFRKVILELNKAKVIIAPKASNGCRLLNPPTKTLKDIFALLALDPESLAVV